MYIQYSSEAKDVPKNIIVKKIENQDQITVFWFTFTDEDCPYQEKCLVEAQYGGYICYIYYII